LERIREWGTARPEWVVLAFWSACLLATLLFGVHGQHGLHCASNIALLLCGLGAGALLVRSRRPLFATLVRAVVVTASFALGHPISGQISRALGMQAVGRELARADLYIFGTHVTERLQALNHPIFVEWLQVNYFLFLVLPVPLLVVLLIERRYRDATFYVSLVNVTMLACFIGYIFLPATTPEQLFMASGSAAPVHFDGPLRGLWLTGPLRDWLLHATSNRYDVFPSGHTAGAAVALIAAWRLHRRAAYALLPTGLTIIYSTLALRYHFAVDVLAGLALAAAIVVVGWRLYEPVPARRSGPKSADRVTDRAEARPGAP